ncbi:DUF924 family protein [Ramlibacter sp. AW1]|uniref:DUF924 family protein n=1 Tax=Ramlibacter aurantiacus TaxID=2801330 RepID=A0A936ZQV9_9BURK|nr:DUF924 family protein [Ramlibacter aurantiacus]MBL0420866.1 DUF924 family protein [Ramlibacter aurantiacus]
MTLPDPSPIRAADVVAFWRDAGPERWFRRDDDFDARFRDRFLHAHEQAARGELADWERNAEGSLALLILLDQFPRNAFRGSARTFATDAAARELARRALAAGHREQVEPALRRFFHLPFTHSESLADQDQAVALARELDADSLKWAEHHRDIVARFGRFPHRNDVLGRESTAQEQAFLAEGGFGGG